MSSDPAAPASSASPPPPMKPDECRVLGVLVEKALTTPAQYPLTLNALTLGCNQKNNRFPVTNFDEDRVLDAVDGLRTKGLVREAMLSGSRVAKYRHLSREVLGVETPALVLLVELMLRGPQSLGELRTNASRMHAFDSMEAVKAVLDELMARTPPMVKEVPPPPGSRARLWVQLLCPNLHPIVARDESGADAPARASEPGAAAHAGPDPELLERIATLETEARTLRAAISRLASRLGEADPF